MTREQAKQNLHHIQAFAEGKPLQYHNPSTGWEDVSYLVGFDQSPEYYRVKPKPRIIHLEIWRGISLVRDEPTGESERFVALTPEVETALKEKGIL